MTGRFPRTVTAGELADAFTGLIEIQHGLPSRTTLRLPGFGEVAGDLMGAQRRGEHVDITVSTGVLLSDGDDERDFDQQDFSVRADLITGFRED